MDDLVARTVTALRSRPRSTDSEIHRVLVAEGMDPAIAARLIEFLPIAYGRLILEKLGLGFPDLFQRRLANGRLSEEQSLSAEPMWNAVVEFTRNKARNGASQDDLLAVAMRSAEFEAVNKLLNRGSQVEDLRFTPVVLPWPETGPQN